jgi:hypothetical protein
MLATLKKDAKSMETNYSWAKEKWINNSWPATFTLPFTEKKPTRGDRELQNEIKPVGMRI